MKQMRILENSGRSNSSSRIIIVVHVVQRWMMSAMINERIYHVIYASIT